MLSKFHRQSVINGCVDYFCLACESVLKTEEDVLSHLDKPIHKKNLDKTSYVESCPADRIRHVNKRYYCECCNILLASSIKVNLHIKEERHNFNKSYESDGEIKKSPFLKWYKSAIIAFDDLLIDEKVWNGFIDGNCIICEDEFKNAEIHRSGAGHNLKLIQAKVQVGSDNFITRKIDEATYHCLTCNTLIAANEMMTHSDTSEHTKLYIECRKAKRALETDNENGKQEVSPVITIANNAVNGTKESNQEKVVEAKKENKADEIKKDTKPVEVKTEKKAAEVKKEHVTEKKAPKLPKEYTADINDVLGLKDYIELYADNGQALCFLCDWVVDRTQVFQHVTGIHHQAILKLQNERTEKMKKKYSSSTETNNVATEKPKETPEKKPVEVPAQEKCNNRDKIIDSVSAFQKNGVRIDMIGDKAFCAKCATNIDFNFDVIEKHIEDHKNEVTKVAGDKYPEMDLANNKTDINKPGASKTDSGSKASITDEKDAATIAKENEITYNLSHNFAFCRICEKKVPSSVKSLQEHVNGNSHKIAKFARNEKAVRPDSPLYRTKSMENYINTFTLVENVFRRDTIINDEMCINVLSFELMTRLDGNMLRCQLCEVSVPITEVNEHNLTRKHEKALRATQVLYTLDSEFVREVRPGIFHCGFCNLIVADFDNVLQHLLSSSHDRSKTTAEWCLEQYMPAIRANRLREREEAEFTSVRPGIFHCGFCNLIVADFDNVLQHLLSSSHDRSKTTAEWCLEQYMPAIRANRLREREEAEFTSVMRMLIAGAAGRTFN